MKISDITIFYNNENDFRSTLKSVVNQTYKNIEYIAVDEVSTDNTLIIISEPDKNLYNAINKETKMTTGKVV